jgi:SSS family solute:Na+ symporter
MSLPALDVAIVAVYAVSIFALAQWVSREKGTHRKDAQDYFLAGRSLPWWAIGTSLIAANISAEQIIGMSGSGYVIGLGIASYEWMSALTLIIVGKYFLPIFLKNNIYTMPEFLERRFSPTVRTVMAIFWIGVYVFVNLTAILWLGATAVHTVTGINVETALIALGVFAGAQGGGAHGYRPGVAAGSRRPRHQLHCAQQDIRRRGHHRGLSPIDPALSR